MFTGGSSEKFRIAPDKAQIDTTHFRPHAPAKSALSSTSLALSRTAVMSGALLFSLRCLPGVALLDGLD
jgi:hypothetical protein